MHNFFLGIGFHIKTGSGHLYVHVFRFYDKGPFRRFFHFEKCFSAQIYPSLVPHKFYRITQFGTTIQPNSGTIG